MFTIFVVEDDATMNGIMLEHLKKWRFKTCEPSDFDHVIESFITCQPHLVLLDINLPAYDGYYWCRKIRNLSQVPIVFLSSRDSRMDKIMAMNMGGDDYVEKPVDLDVLTAKINALLRRAYSYINHEARIIEYNGAVLNLSSDRIFSHGRQTELTKNESKIMYLLMKSAGEVVTREEIMRALWKDERFIDDNTLTVNIVRLRKKLGALGLDAYIKTKKGQGYMLP